MTQQYANPLAHLIETAAHLIADPDNSIAFTRADERGIAPVVAACKKDADSLHKPRSPLNRNAFLCGCIEATHGHGLEHLIVGFGRKHGKTTKVEQIAHNRGTPDTVAIPPHIRSAMINHVQAGFANEVILFHNHPPSWINAVFDNQPLPSLTDRATLTDYHSQPIILLKLLFGGGRVRFYLGENGFVREFRTPHIRVLISHLQSLGIVSRKEAGSRR